ncbi:homogentisate 1,2-dioxygenase [Mycobacterium gastri]|uniref:Homogentisate 1,2-dioxygenase n=1 Tax=Mycobacterium gastri TaxID=1777 RepID=A0A1X1VD48_MYCGS|nr:homogentisate 1,2-dioxygenase [Mycobacterium gastri]ETW22486.1 homogentisate 1,2-dioxygenase [Mycobacterium gastri 'Wayne']ORV66878.1 hypothetical protein AWC07_10530 [Mycobacterium gastri]
MESFVHLRKGKTPRRLHADLDGLKDDELGRSGFAGRTANIYRRHDPTAYRAEGPLRPIDVLCSELKPGDATDANGALGRHFPFDPSQATIPEPVPIADDGRNEYEVRLIHDGGPTRLYYQHDPIDVEGWRGDNFAFTFNIADYNVITSDSVHLPPTVHLFMQATGVYVMNFLPKPAEGVQGTERTPWYHRNVDYDEIAFFHGGSLYGIPMPAGLISHAPQGIHHGAPERARERTRRKFNDYSTVDWQVIAIDTRRRLTPSDEVLAHDLGQH